MPGHILDLLGPATDLVLERNCRVCCHLVYLMLENLCIFNRINQVYSRVRRSRITMKVNYVTPFKSLHVPETAR